MDNGKFVVVVVTLVGGQLVKRKRDSFKQSSFAKIANLNSGLIKVKIKVLDDDNTFEYKRGSPIFNARSI